MNIRQEWSIGSGTWCTLVASHRPLVYYIVTSAKEDMFSSDLHEIVRDGWQWASEQMIKFYWRSESPSGHRDCFPDSLLLGDTESRINRLRCATLQCSACNSRHRHSNYDVITSPAHDRQPRQMCLGGGMHCPSVSGLKYARVKT